MDESAYPFGPAGRRAAAVDPPDRITLSDHLRSVEIGAFASERGVEQRLRFAVALEIAAPPAGLADDVDRVVSYEIIVSAIDEAIAAGRVDLVETLAERVAARCLAEPRALRAFVRIEKLDRGPGALGVEIVRRPPPRGLHAGGAAAEAARRPRPRVLYLPPALLAGPEAAAWIAAAAAHPGPAAVATGPERPEAPAGAEGARRAGLLAIDAAAWRIADRDARLVVAAARAELDWALATGRRPVWAPARMLAEATPRPEADASRPEALAAWLAGALGAEELVLAGPAGENRAADPPTGVALRRAASPADFVP